MKTRLLKISNIMLVLVLFTGIMQAQKVETGIVRLSKQSFKQLAGKRVGLITNPTGVDASLQSTIDILHDAPQVQLVALFSPEHGVRGDFSAGDKVTDAKDTRTGLPVYSLYGKTRKPTPEMLRGIDILVYDIQDIGSRSYTYISTLGLAMEAAAENGIELVVLDRPNPLGGKRMEGSLTEKDFTSFVSQFPIPYIHGLTCGELALFLNGERLLANGIQCNLTVIPMKGWKRKMLFQETGLPWVLSSPHIPHAESAFYYPASGILGELSHVNIGVGYTLPFELFGTTWIEDPETLANNLNALKLEGVSFRPLHYKPYYGGLKDSLLAGVQLHIRDFEKVSLSIIQFYVMQEWHKMYPDRNIFDENKADRISMFDKVCGTDQVRKLFSNRFRVEDIMDLWTKDVDSFYKKAKPYFLYK